MELSLEHISLKYEGANGTLYIFKDMNYRFSKNELVSVVGESGSGKTSLLNIIAGYNLDYEGKIKTSCDLKEVAFVFQNLNLVSHLSVIENVMLPLLLFNIPRKEAYERSVIALKKTGIEREKDKRIDELSGGQRARVSLSRALVTSSKIILADEPTGALDSVTSDEIMKLLKNLSKDHLVIVVTHNEELANKYSDLILTIDNYKLKTISKKEVRNFHSNSDKLKIRTVNLKTSFKLAMSFLKGKLAKVSLAVFFSSLCFSFLLMTFSLVSKGSEELISLGKDYYDFDVVCVSRKKEIKIDDSSLKIVRNVRLDSESESYFKSQLQNHFFSYVSLDRFIFPYSSYYIGEKLSEAKVSFKPSFTSLAKIKNGRPSDNYREVVCNLSFLKNHHKKIGDKIRIKNDVRITTSFEEKKVDDLLRIDVEFTIVGVAKEKDILTHETIYYDYLNMRDHIYDLKLTEASSFLDRNFTVRERVEKYSVKYDSLLDSKSICRVSDPLKLKEIVKNMKDEYKVESEALNMVEAMKNLIDSFSKVVVIFVALALICSFFLEYVFIENIYKEKTKELALYLSFHISKKSFFRLGLGQVIIFSFMNLTYSLIMFVAFTFLGNQLLKHYDLPLLFSLNLKGGFVVLVVLTIFMFSYLVGQLSLRNIYKTNLIDSLKSE